MVTLKYQSSSPTPTCSLSTNAGEPVGTVLNVSSSKEDVTPGVSVLQTDVVSNALETRNLEPQMDGSIWPNCCLSEKSNVVENRPWLLPLSTRAEQMVLGTLLGDGSMCWTNAKYGRYRINHGAIQAEYCRSKAKLLEIYVNTPPQIKPNGGWGKEICTFSTVTSPAFEYLRTLCYHPSPDDGRLVKWVTPQWLAKLTWEGIAWWYQDDGTLQKSTRTVVFCTHSFPESQVRLLARMLTDYGAPAKARPVLKGQKMYWVVYLTAAGTRVFMEKVRPYMHPTMFYKLTDPLPIQNCQFCGAKITEPIRNFNLKAPCCKKPECQRQRNRERNQRWAQKLGKTEINERSRCNHRKRMQQHPEAQKRRNARQRERFSDPACRSEQNAWKREWRRQRKLQGLPRM